MQIITEFTNNLEIIQNRSTVIFSNQRGVEVLASQHEIRVCKLAQKNLGRIVLRVAVAAAACFAAAVLSWNTTFIICAGMLLSATVLRVGVGFTVAQEAIRELGKAIVQGSSSALFNHVIFLSIAIGCLQPSISGPPNGYLERIMDPFAAKVGEGVAHLATRLRSKNQVRLS